MVRVGKGKISEILNRLDAETFDVAAEVIAEDVERVGVKNFIRFLLECCDIECIAKAVLKAEEKISDT